MGRWLNLTQEISLLAAGADITDYFNYGFTEDTWMLYCEKQKRLRSENGVMTLGVSAQRAKSSDAKRGVALAAYHSKKIKQDSNLTLGVEFGAHHT